MTSLYLRMPSRSVEDALAHSSWILHLSLPYGAFRIASPWEVHLHLQSLLALHQRWCHSVVLGDHLAPSQAVAGVGLGFGCIPVLGILLLSLLFEAFPLLDLIVPQLYVSDVSCDGGGDPFVSVEPAGRPLGLPRLAMIMGSSSSAALLLAAFRRSPREWVVACLGNVGLSSRSSVILVAPR